MTAIIEEKIKHCNKCNNTTKHYRNTTKSSGFMIMVHVILILITLGVWLPIVVIYKILFAKIGGWSCGSC